MKEQLMQKRILIKDLQEHVGKEVFLQGWVQELRNLNKIKFLIIRDRSGDMQTVAFKGETEAESFELINKITKESVVEINGIVKANKESRWGIEVGIKKLNISSLSEAVLPIDNSDKGLTVLDKRIDHRFLDMRNKKTQAIFKIRSKIAKLVVNFLDQEGFTNINTPKLTTIGVESGAELFEVKYFNRNVYLAQSPQIYKQMFVAGGLERVYEIGAVYRAEKSHTMRHLTEFTGIDFEMGFINDFTDIMDLIERMFIDVLQQLSQDCSIELQLLGVTHDIPKNIPRVTMEEAKKMLAAKGRKYSPDEDLDAEGEKLLGELVKEKYGSEFIFLTHFPVEVRPFYHMRFSNNNKLTKSFDLLFCGTEIATGAQREHRYDVLKEQAKEKGIDLDSMKEYAEIFQYGIPAHGGVGLGLDRITQRLLLLENIREAVLLPRDPERVAP